MTLLECKPHHLPKNSLIDTSGLKEVRSARRDPLSRGTSRSGGGAEGVVQVGAVVVEGGRMVNPVYGVRETTNSRMCWAGSGISNKGRRHQFLG